MLPARSGSKGVKDKNIKLLDGKPLMYYTLDAIMSSKSYKKHNCYVFVNTDSEKYAKIAKKGGAQIPFLRKESLAGDSSSIKDTIKDTFLFFEEKQVKFDIFAMIQVTSPLITNSDIDNAIKEFENDENIDVLNSVTESEIMPLWCNKLSDDLLLNDFIDEKVKLKNRQELPKYYRVTGAIRMARWNFFKENNFDWYRGKSKAFIMSNEKSVDIDSELDFEWAEFLLKRRNNHE